MKDILDIRHSIFVNHMDKIATAVLIVEDDGILSGMKRAIEVVEAIGVNVSSTFQDGTYVKKNTSILQMNGDAVQIVKAEEQVIGTLSKSSGIATAAYKAKSVSPRNVKIVSGGWKKMPISMKEIVRKAVKDGGIDCRMSNGDFVYLDKNYVRILGGVKDAAEIGINQASEVVIQIRGEFAPIEDEAEIAARSGSSIIMVDTGNLVDLEKVALRLKETGLRSDVKIAFAGNIAIDSMQDFIDVDVNILDIGYAILDAPCLAMRFDVVKVN